MPTIYQILLVLAFACLLVAALSVSVPRVNLLALGLALVVLAMLLRVAP